MFSKVTKLFDSKVVDFSITHPVPGLELPLDYIPTKDDPLYVGDPLPTALLEEYVISECPSKVFLPMTTTREFVMLRFMNQVTDQPSWHKKVFDPKIVKKWRRETAGDLAYFGGMRLTLTSPMFKYCIAELQYVAKHVYPQRTDGALIVFNGNVVKSDEAVTKSVKRALQRAVKPLENVPKEERDWHLGSGKTVLDLVHPDLYPLVYGKSRVLGVGEKVAGIADCLARCGDGRVIPVVDCPPEVNDQGGAQPYSLKYQWLPCEVDISGDSAKIVSYINNLHPNKHADVYDTIEKVMDAAIPLWQLSLAPLYDAKFEFFSRIVYDDDDLKCADDDPNREDDDGGGSGEESSEEGHDPYEENGYDSGGDHESDQVEEVEWVEADILDEKDNDDDDDEVNRETDDREEDEEDEIPFILVQPEPEAFKPDNIDSPKPISFDTLHGKQGRPLQIIVKLENIELTPKRPKYKGGKWHIEGKQNEHICAAALYCYSSSNIRPLNVSFRQFVDADSANNYPDEGGQYEFLRGVFGCEPGKTAFQEVGKVEVKNGRLLTFPNILQHQIQPTELADRTRKGYMKILTLFLVDPNVKVISTANVPCQQLDWWREIIDRSGSDTASSRASIGSQKSKRSAVRSVLKETLAKGLSKLPTELKDHVFGQVDGFPITRIDAKATRVKLMKERKKFVKDLDNLVKETNSFQIPL